MRALVRLLADVFLTGPAVEVVPLAVATNKTAVLAATARVVGLACVPVGIRQR